MHGGLGTTVEALRNKKPTTVTGVLLFDQASPRMALGWPSDGPRMALGWPSDGPQGPADDPAISPLARLMAAGSLATDSRPLALPAPRAQRFWGAVCADKGVGPPPTLVHHFEASCIEFANHALDPASEYARVAASLELGDAHDDGVDANVAHFEQLLSGGTLKPVVTKPPPLPMIKGFRGCLG